MQYFFLFVANDIQFCVRITFSLLIYLPIGTVIDYILTIVSGAAINTGMQTFSQHKNIISFGYTLTH